MFPASSAPPHETLLSFHETGHSLALAATGVKGTAVRFRPVPCLPCVPWATGLVRIHQLGLGALRSTWERRSMRFVLVRLVHAEARRARRFGGVGPRVLRASA